MSIKRKFRKLLWMMGCDISRFSPTHHPLARRIKLFESYKIDVVLDVGANIGQFATQMRKDLGYSGRIISFEPLSSAFQLLKINADKDPQWEALNYALGDTEATEQIHIAGNSQSSSLLNMLPSHIKVAPESKYIGSEEVEIKTLDSVFDGICSKNNRIYLKIDAQVFESKVLKGAESSLSKIDTIQLEMSLIPLYEGELIFSDMHNLLSKKGYSLVSIETGFSDQSSGQLMQADGIFHRF